MATSSLPRGFAADGDDIHVDDANPETTARIARRLQVRQTEQVLVYLRRTHWSYLGYLVIAAVSYRQGLAVVLGSWLAAVALVNTARWLYARRVERMPPEERVNALPWLLRGFAVAGLTVASVVPFVFSHSPSSFSPLVVSCLLLVTMSVAADGVAGSVPGFLSFAVPVMLSISGSWLMYDGMRGAAAICLGVLLAFFLLLSGVRDRRRTLLAMERMIDLNARLSQVARFERDRARDASEAKTRFLASASHDLRQPLHTISMLTGGLALRPLDARSGEIVALLEQVVASLTAQLDGLLDVSKLDAGIVQAECHAVDLAALVDMLADEWRGAARAKGLALEAEAHRGEPVLVHTDAQLLTRVLRNLIDNAIKFTPPHGQVKLSFARSSEGASAWVRVEDSGIGMTAEQQAQVFREFYQVGNVERDRSRGLGLGLSIVQRLVGLLGARMQMASAPGEGTRFTLHLPLADAAALPPPAPAEADEPPLRFDATVLVIDDEKDVRTGIRFLLEELGCRCLEASGTAEAVEAVAQCRPDLVLSDFRLRGGDSGLAAVAALRQALGPVPAMLISGDTAPDRLQEAAAAGIRLLHKPLSLATLRTELQRATAHRAS